MKIISISMALLLYASIAAAQSYCIPDSNGLCINPWSYPSLDECNLHLADVQKFCGPGQMPVALDGHIITLSHHMPVYSGFGQTVVNCAAAQTTACVELAPPTPTP